MNNYFNYKHTFEQNKSYYKILVKKLHPDKGGNTKDFIDLQNQWEKYKQNYKTHIDFSVKAETNNQFDDFIYENKDEFLNILQKKIKPKTRFQKIITQSIFNLIKQNLNK